MIHGYEDQSALSKADRFLASLAEVPLLVPRLEALVYRDRFNDMAYEVEKVLTSFLPSFLPLSPLTCLCVPLQPLRAVINCSQAVRFSKNFHTLLQVRQVVSAPGLF
jgi:hypothetical protein